MTHAEILTPAQQLVLNLLGKQEDLQSVFTLSGGTALAAFHLQHRTSDDLDFFSQKHVDELRVRRFAEDARALVGASMIDINRIYDRTLFFLDIPGKAGLKLEFTLYPYVPLEKPSLYAGVQVESLRDIATDKLAALLDRFEPKDYYDIYYLLSRGHTTLPQMRADLEKKLSLRADPMSLGAAFMRAGNLPVLPHLLEKISTEEVKHFFLKEAKGLRSEVME